MAVITPYIWIYQYTLPAPVGTGARRTTHVGKDGAPVQARRDLRPYARGSAGAQTCRSCIPPPYTPAAWAVTDGASLTMIYRFLVYGSAAVVRRARRRRQKLSR